MAEDKEQPVKISTENQTDQPTAHDSEYPGIWSLVAIMVALYLAIFLVALVRYHSNQIKSSQVKSNAH